MLEGGIIGLIHLALVIWALVNIFQSSYSTGGKILWAAVVFFMPVLGFILWLLFGPRSASRAVTA